MCQIKPHRTRCGHSKKIDTAVKCVRLSSSPTRPARIPCAHVGAAAAHQRRIWLHPCVRKWMQSADCCRCKLNSSHLLVSPQTWTRPPCQHVPPLAQGPTCQPPAAAQQHVETAQGTVKTSFLFRAAVGGCASNQMRPAAWRSAASFQPQPAPTRRPRCPTSTTPSSL